jgi:hypothetical protein
MGKIRSVKRQRTVRGFTKAVISQGGDIENGGRHSKFVSPDGVAKVPFPNHTGDLARGTSFSITKALLALGFVCLVLYCLF